MEADKRNNDLVTVEITSSFNGKARTGRVTRNTDTTDNIIAEIINRSGNVTEEECKNVLSYYSKELIERIRDGHAVELAGLGTLYIKAQVTQDDDMTTSAVKGFTVGFTPNAAIKEAAATLKVDKVVAGDVNPRIDTVCDLRNSGIDGNVSADTFVELWGIRLKVFGSDSGIFFAESNNGVMESDESLWEKVDMTTLSNNTSKLLRFALPSALTKGKDYFIVLRTRFSNTGDQTKQLREYITKTPIHII